MYHKHLSYIYMTGQMMEAANKQMQTSLQENKDASRTGEKLCCCRIYRNTTSKYSSEVHIITENISCQTNILYQYT